jgi:streptogramin lyase
MVWTGGKNFNSADEPNHMSCVQRFDPSSKQITATTDYPSKWLRGIAVGSGKSAGYVWAAESNGLIYKIDMDTMAVVKTYQTPAYNPDNDPCTNEEGCSQNNLVGMAIDYQGYVWSVSTTKNAAYKFDPSSETFVVVEVGESPYTYSDMTGMQLMGAIIIK